MKYKLAVIGACGNIGHEILQILADKGIAVDEVVAIDHKKLAGREVSYGDDYVLKVYDIETFDFADCGIAMFAEKIITKDYADKAHKSGAYVITYDQPFRAETELVVPEVNGQAIRSIEGSISPSAAVVAAAMALFPLHQVAPIKRVVISTYHSVSHESKQAMDELFDQSKSLFSVNEYKSEVFAKQVSFNVIPQVGNFAANGDTLEEVKIVTQLENLFDGAIRVAASCVYVPVFVGNSLNINIEFEKEMKPEEARKILRTFKGVVVVDKLEAEDGFVTPAEIAGDDAVYVGRIREDKSVEHGLNIWVVCDNIRKGAALNMVQIAEIALRK